jgi:hypothetical protein
MVHGADGLIRFKISDMVSNCSFISWIESTARKFFGDRVYSLIYRNH